MKKTLCLWLCACWWLFTAELQYVYSWNLFGFSSRGACLRTVLNVLTVMQSRQAQHTLLLQKGLIGLKGRQDLVCAENILHVSLGPDLKLFILMSKAEYVLGAPRFLVNGATLTELHNQVKLKSSPY